MCIIGDGKRTTTLYELDREEQIYKQMREKFLNSLNSLLNQTGNILVSYGLELDFSKRESALNHIHFFQRLGSFEYWRQPTTTLMVSSFFSVKLRKFFKKMYVTQKCRDLFLSEWTFCKESNNTKNSMRTT